QPGADQLMRRAPERVGPLTIATTVRLGSFDAFPVAGPRRSDGERDGFGVRQGACAAGRWAALELRVARAAVDDAEPRRARIALDAAARVRGGQRRHCHLGLRAACPP